MTRIFTAASLLACAVCLTACQPDASTDVEGATGNPESLAATAAESKAIAHSLAALPGLESEVPILTRKQVILMKTDAGDLTIEVYPEAAPNAAERFVELVTNGFYTNTPISRVVPGFVAQFGVNWRENYVGWQERNFNDDPTLFALERGTLAFAKAGPNTNSTQVFINYVENNRLATPQYNFTVFGKIVEGMEVVDSFVVVGDPGGGLDQGRLWTDGENYLNSLELKPTMILSASLVE